MYVCHVFAYFAFPLPSWRYIYNDEVYVCLLRFCMPNCQNALAPSAMVGSRCAHLPLGIANNRKFIMIIMNVDCHDDDDWL